jgi:hypothetical protein
VRHCKAYGEAGTTTEGAANVDRASVCFGQVAGDREPEPDARLGASRHLKELVEHVRQVALGDAPAAILDRNRNLAAARLARDGDRRIGRTVLDAVWNQGGCSRPSRSADPSKEER